MKTKLILLAAAALSICGCSQPEEAAEIKVFAAASMKASLNEAIAKYKTAHPNIEVVAYYESSGTLQVQIENAADECDLFISAGAKQMNALQEKGLIDVESRFNILENQVTLCVPESNPHNITSFQVLSEKLKSGSYGDFMLGLGGPTVPVGQYSSKILEYYQIDEASLVAAGVVTYGKNVTEVASFIKNASVSAGIVYKTDAFTHELKVVDAATKEMCGQVLYPAALIKNNNGEKTKNAADKFLRYLTNSEAMESFNKVGFVAACEPKAL